MTKKVVVYRRRNFVMESQTKKNKNQTTVEGLHIGNALANLDVSAREMLHPIVAAYLALLFLPICIVLLHISVVSRGLSWNA